MADLITLTQQPAIVTSAIYQPMLEAIDVSAYDYLDFLLLATQASASTVIQIVTGVDLNANTSWQTVLSFDSFSTAPTVSLKSSWGLPLMRYIRWNVGTYTSGTSTFAIRAMARRFR